MSNTKLESLGAYFTNQPQPNYDVEINPRTQREFSCTYGSSFTDSTITSLVRPNVTYTRKSLIESEIIGHGDLTTPANFYPNVLLERYIWDGVTIAPNGGTNEFVETTYFFWAPGYYHPLMAFVEGYSNQSGNISTYKFISYFFGVTYIELEELRGLKANNISVFPNPANDFIEVTRVKSTAAYSLIAANGAILQKGILKTNENIIKVEHLPPGNYLLLIEGGENQSVIQFVKQ